MNLALLVFQAFQNSWTHIQQVQFSLEVKKTLSKEELSLEKLTFFNNYTNIFHLRVENEEDRIVSNIQIQNNVYYGNRNMYDVLEIYSVYTTKDYRKRGMAKYIIYKSVEKMCEIYHLKCPILVLHLNPEDPMMHIVFSFYVNLGFHSATYVRTGPSDVKFSMDIKLKFFPWHEVLQRPVTNKHLTLFAFNGFNNDVTGNFTQMGKKVVEKISEWIEVNKDMLENSESSNS